MESTRRSWLTRVLAARWFLAFVPINAATAGFGVVLPLLILLPLHGSWSEVAFAATLFNAAVIASSVLWGHLADRYPRRRLFLVINYAGFGALYLLLALVPSLNALYAIYTVIGLIAPAGASAGTLLLLEKFPETDRANAYSSFQEMAIVGSMAGLLLGYVWTSDSFELSSILYLLAALAVASAFGIWFGVTEGARPATTNHVARHFDSAMARIRETVNFRIMIPFFPVRPRVRRDSFHRLRTWAREELHHEIPLVLGAMFLFNFSANLFNISFTPYLTSVGVAASSIFLINLSNNTAQGVLFPFSGGITSRAGPDRLVRLSSYLRALSYLATAMFALTFLVNGPAFVANAVSYALAGAAIAFFTISSSMMLFRGLRGRDSGRILGANSALGGVAAVAGAATSGVIALFGSFDLVFLLASGALLASLPLWTAATVAFEKRRGPVTVVARIPPPSPGVPPAQERRRPA